MKPVRFTSVVLALLTILATLVASTSATGVSPGEVSQVQGTGPEHIPLRGRHFYGGGSQVGYIGVGGTNLTTRVSVTSRGGSKPSKADIRKAVEKQGVKVTKVGKVRGFTKKYKAFNAENYRHNLSMHTGYGRVEADAHHIMPRFREAYFKARGINIHHPKNLTWWYRPSHAKFAAQYNREWQTWINKHPRATKKQVRAQARRMYLKYLEHYAKPGPGGCKVYDCLIDPRDVGA